MKKVLCFLFVLILLLPVFSKDAVLHKFVLGSGVSFYGTSDGKSGLDVNFIYRPFSFSFANPFARLETGVEFNKDDFGFSLLKIQGGVELFRSAFNPLFFTTQNKSPWIPAVSFGLATQWQKFFTTLDFVVEVSPFRVMDKDFIYEWFMPFFVFNCGVLKNWGIYFFRLTSMF